MTRESAISRATLHFDEGQFIADLARRVAIRTESQIPESRPYMDVYLKSEITPAFEHMGFKTEILPNPVEGVGPILLAERIEGSNLPTVLMYGHGDVIRGLEDQWRTGIEPWLLKQEGGYRATTQAIPLVRSRPGARRRELRSSCARADRCVRCES